MTRSLINTCALLALGLLLIIWLRGRWVVLTPRREWRPSPSAVLGPLPFEVEWRVPVGCGFSGFFVEVALGFMLPLASSGSFHLLCGKCEEDFLTGQLTVREADAIRKTWTDEEARTPAQTRAAIVIEHGDPCGMRRWSDANRPLWVIARTMTEGDLAPEQADCLRAADEVWVPTRWHVERFVAAGLPRSQLRIVPEPVGLDTFAPHAASTTAASAAAVPSRPFVFLSNFKWEQRKGWDLLLRAYWAEFSSEAKGRVLLRIKTYLPSWEPGPRDLDEWLDTFAAEQGVQRAELPTVVLLQGEDMPRATLRNLYAAADAFVLPTRGEGWGLPIAEAMAMALPVIATNWSGPTALLSADNSFPLPPARMLPGGQAEPSVPELRRAMRTVLEQPGEAAARGARAREDMARWYTPSAVAGLAWERLRDAAVEACAKRPSHAACQRPHATAVGESTQSTRPGL